MRLVIDNVCFKNFGFFPHFLHFNFVGAQGITLAGSFWFVRHCLPENLSANQAKATGLGHTFNGEPDAHQDLCARLKAHHRSDLLSTMDDSATSKTNTDRDAAAITCFQAAIASHNDSRPEITGKWTFPAADPTIASWKPATLSIKATESGDKK